MRRPRAFVCVAALFLGMGGCVSDEVSESAVNVLTLQRGTLSELRARRGRGPFRSYPVEPARMLGVIERAVARARGAGGLPVSAVFVSALRGEVVAKERGPEEAADERYAPPFCSAMLAIVHPAPDRADACRVEIHAIQRGPFHRGVVAWQRDLPGWIDAVLAEDREAAAPLAPIP